MNIDQIIKGIEEPVMALVDRIEAQGLNGIWWVQHDDEVWGVVGDHEESLLLCCNEEQAEQIAALGPEGLLSILSPMDI